MNRGGIPRLFGSLGGDAPLYSEAMPYVLRTADGLIASLHREAPHAGAEWLPELHPEVMDFVGAGEGAELEFARLDADFVRVLEDVIDTLIGKNLINITDLPAEAQGKLFSRKSFRERRSSHALNLFGSDDAGMPLPLPDEDR